jgi:hypothetical protein
MRSWLKNGKRMVALNFSMPEDAVILLRRYSPSGRSYGQFLARLIFEHQARLEERQRIRQAMEAMVGE